MIGKLGEEWRGKEYSVEISSDKYLEIVRTEKGFSLEWKVAEPPLHKTLTDTILCEWLENPIAFGAFCDDNGKKKLLGFVEGFLEQWNNRFRITNICVFDSTERKKGLGERLLSAIMSEAKKSGARMVVLETQSYNFKAISFYKKHGFEIIGFDLYAYSNSAPKERNIRIEMGKIIV